MAQDAIALLKSDHKTVLGLLEQLSETTTRATKKRRQLLEKIAQELHAHARIEEEFFYPAFREAGGKEHEKMFHEAKEEHRAVEALVLPDLRKAPADDLCFSGRAKVLKELVEHHAEEEEKEMFPAARKAMGRDELKELGVRMAARKKEILSGKRSLAA